MLRKTSSFVCKIELLFVARGVVARGYRPNRHTATTSRTAKSSSILQTELLVSRDIFASSEIIELSTLLTSQINAKRKK